MCIWSVSGYAVDLLRNLWYCVPFPVHCNRQLVAKSNKMFNKPHVLSFLALPLCPCGCEPETDTTPPLVRCNFACVLCAHACACAYPVPRFSHSRVSWRNLCWAAESNLKLTSEREGKKPPDIFFLWKVKMLLCSGAVLPGREKVGCPGEWKSQISVSQHKCWSWSEREDSLLCHLTSVSSAMLP